jgi:hypothetical protein
VASNRQEPCPSLWASDVQLRGEMLGGRALGDLRHRDRLDQLPLAEGGWL